MSDAPSGRDRDGADGRPIAHGGSRTVSWAARLETVVDRTRRAAAAETPPLGDAARTHRFGPAELPPWVLSLPVVGGLAVAVGAQGTTVLASGDHAAWLGTVLTAMVTLVAVSVALRSA